MWSADSWTEVDEGGIADSRDLAGTFEEKASPSSNKRQRRPNVRLEDLGDQHGSPAADNGKKKTGKLLGAGISVRSGGLHKRIRFDTKDAAQKAENAVLRCVNGSAELCPPVKKAAKLKQILKVTNRIVQKGVRKPSASIKKSSRALQLGSSIGTHCKQKVPGMHDAKDIHFDKENNAHTATRFEDVGYCNVVSPFERGEQGEMMLLHADQNYQSGELSMATAQAMGGRANQWAQAVNRMHGFKLSGDADGSHLAHTDGYLHVPKGKLVMKKNLNKPMHGTRNAHVIGANGNGDRWETRNINAVRQCLRPWIGVREWLQGLGLGKYAQLFEAHEVEPEVLPLLTLDDLREIGVAAVGSRRKMFYAIQHIRKALLAETG